MVSKQWTRPGFHLMTTYPAARRPQYPNLHTNADIFGGICQPTYNMRYSLLRDNRYHNQQQAQIVCVVHTPAQQPSVKTRPHHILATGRRGVTTIAAYRLRPTTSCPTHTYSAAHSVPPVHGPQDGYYLLRRYIPCRIWREYHQQEEPVPESPDEPPSDTSTPVLHRRSTKNARKPCKSKLLVHYGSLKATNCNLQITFHCARTLAIPSWDLHRPLLI